MMWRKRRAERARSDLADIEWLRQRRRFLLAVLVSRGAWQHDKIVSLDPWRGGGSAKCAGASVARACPQARQLGVQRIGKVIQNAVGFQAVKMDAARQHSATLIQIIRR